jgi:DNA-binding transcriptional regulator YiaG
MPFRPMTPAEYVKLRKALGKSNYAAAPLLGISRRTAHRYEHGQWPVAETVAKLLRLLERHGIPQEWEKNGNG